MAGDEGKLANMNEKVDEDDEFRTENLHAQKLTEYVNARGVIGHYKICKVVGAGANGVVALVNHMETNETAVMKIAMNLSASGSLYWESDVMDHLLHAEGEDHTRHLVRKLDAGHTKNHLQEVGYIVMEYLPGNPVGILGYLSGRALIQKTCEFGLQLLRALYDIHLLGFVHRDVKPENVGLFQDKLLILYDLGMARFITDSQGNLREPRCNVGMRGTDEWASLYAENGRDQGRIDDLWGWFYVLIEWINCSSKYPLAWAPYDSHAHIRHLMKSTLYPAKLVLHNCPSEFYRIHSYLRLLSRNSTPNYFYLANTLHECKKRMEEEQKLEEANKPKPKIRRARFPTFFEVEQMLDDYDEYHADTTVAGKMDLKRVGVETIGAQTQPTAEPKEPTVEPNAPAAQPPA
ncbi:Protein kinase domain-containing protein [Aphelenchoides besseyi]|nr:Protein kinase domain-containing protein [Aphelenchoides besseyi]KAI6210824.1 Protein kinase domain-containing protein [Aphelenchoides besseyi]